MLRCCGDLWNVKGSLSEVIQLQSWRTNTGTHPSPHALLYSLWDPLKMKCYGFSCPKKRETKYVLYKPVFGFFTSHSICTKIGWQWEQPWQGMANTDGLKAKGSSTAEATAPEQLLTRCTCLAQSWHWEEGAEPQWHNSSVLLKSVHLTPTYACRHLGSWNILAANREVMGCTFLWKHSLSVCCLSVSVDSLSLRVPFVLLVFICPSKYF